MITVPRLPWFWVTAEACGANAVISDSRAMMYRIIICRGQISAWRTPTRGIECPACAYLFVYLYVYLPLTFKHVLQLQYDFDFNAIPTTHNLYLRSTGICFFPFSLPGVERHPIKRKPHGARTLHITKESIWHARMSDTEGAASNGTTTSGVVDAGAPPAGSESVAEGSTAGAGSCGSGAASAASGAASQSWFCCQPSLSTY